MHKRVKLMEKLFIASSSELRCERMEIVDLIQDLNDEMRIQHAKCIPVLWEYIDSSMGVKRKEDEYLDKLRECEICIVMFWRTLGEYTLEELDVAVKEMRAGRLPKQVYVLFKEPANSISKELMSFKDSFSKKYRNITSYQFDNAKTLRAIVTNIFLNCIHI